MDKDAQYDRQVRLWGEHGQRALEAAHVCLAGATGLGSEALKSLALAGVGAVTIVDGEDAREEDLGVNFLLEESSVGKSRAAETLRLLLELNPTVRGAAVGEAPERLLEERPDFFAAGDFSAVIACGLSERGLRELGRGLWEADVPLIVARSVGFVGSLRIQLKEHCVVEAHPDDRPPDLRLDRPFAKLQQYFDSFDLENASLEERARAPWLVIVANAVRDWKKSENTDAWPENRLQKDQVKDIIRKYGRTDENGFPIEEENYREALSAVNSALVPYKIPSPVADLLKDNSCTNPTNRSAPFWIICAAIKSFVDDEGTLPLSGALPDMTAATDKYVELQNLYRAKAQSDADSVVERVERIASELGVVERPCDSDVRNACRHSSTLRVIRGSPIERENDSSQKDGDAWPWYVALRAAERFRAEQCRAPGEWDADADAPKLKTCAQKLLDDERAREMCRYGGAELHSVSAFIGGCVAHEAVKLVTKQYVPVDNLLVYEATTGNTSTFKV